jgi:hypothetical protein
MTRDTLGVYLSRQQWNDIRRLIDQPLGGSFGTGDGDNGSPFVGWIHVTADITATSGPWAHARRYSGVATWWDEENQQWVDDTGVVKVKHPTGGILYTDQRYFCSAAQWRGTVASTGSALADTDFGVDANGNDVYLLFVVVNPPELEATIAAAGIDSCGETIYGWSLISPQPCPTNWTGYSGTGGLGAQLILSGGGGSVSAPAVYNLNFSTTGDGYHAAPSGGSFTINLSGTSYGPIAFSTTEATLLSNLNAAFGGAYTATDSGGSPPIIITAASYGAATAAPVVTSNALQPGPSNPAYEKNGKPLDSNIIYPGTYNCKIMEGVIADQSCVVKQTQATDGLTTSDIWTVTIANMSPGSQYTLYVDGTESSMISSTASSTDFSTAIGAGPTVSGSAPTYTITYSDFVPHTVRVGNMASVGGMRTWVFEYVGMPTTCISEISGILLSSLAGFNSTSGAINVLGIDSSGCLTIVPVSTCESL